MRRRARSFVLVRGRLPASVRALSISPQYKWPPHLERAWKILDHKLGLPNRAARTIVFESALAAYKCAQEISERAKTHDEYEMRIKVSNAFARLANCVRRAPAELRLSVDQQLAPLVCSTIIDLEVIEEIIDAATAAFQQFPEHEAAGTALGALRARSRDGERIIGLKTDYSILNFDAQRSCELALSALAGAPTKAVVASSAFEALRSAIASLPPPSNRFGVSDLIVVYVAAVAVLWRKHGLTPSRATRRGDPKYRSRFHRFADLILTAMTEPGSRRHDGNDDQIAHGLRLAHRQLPIELRHLLSPALGRADVKWLVSEDHVRKALRLPIQKIAPDTP